MPGPIQSIERAAAVLRLLARSGRLGVGEVASALGLAKPTAHGILRTLQGVGFVEQEPGSGKYRLGTALREVGTGYLDPNDLRSRAINWADALAARTGEAVRIAARAGDDGIVVVHHVFRPDNSEQVLEVGEPLPPHATALGKVLLAYDADLAAQQRGALTAVTYRSVVDRAALDKALAQVRQDGWAGQVEEFRSGVAGIAAPIRSRGGLVVGAIGIAGRVERLCDARLRFRPKLVGHVRDAARAVSRELGAQ
ncbi:DNA-binding IclR family transcriptional regulator [Nocardia transvalensis]|uniref:Glycerol operon regulatory protein n=1 Tax=Nocardia transvalensis TaxID=37333 RepID=A0A7W9PLA3_9NOCA|nr:IclR family transcriptional regulator [Nocardia transvalensis]MBB5917573.1 DNA-binding IclR family transcriptional regulator [Nocardia transvalensis]